MTKREYAIHDAAFALAEALEGMIYVASKAEGSFHPGRWQDARATLARRLEDYGRAIIGKGPRWPR